MSDRPHPHQRQGRRPESTGAGQAGSMDWVIATNRLAAATHLRVTEQLANRLAYERRRRT